MKKYFVAILLCVSLVAIAAVLILNKRPAKAAGAFWYIDNAATGANNGTSWTNAWQSFSAINWTSIQPGDTIYISGGATSKTYNEQLTIGASGAQGNPITIKVGQDVGHNGQVILDGIGTIANYGIHTAGRKWVTISGQLGNNTTPNMVVKNHIRDEIYLYQIEGIVIEYLDIGPITSYGPGYGHCVHVNNGYTWGNNRIHHNKIHNCYDYQILVSQPWSTHPPVVNDDHLRIDHNEIYNLGHDGIHGDRASGITIDHNDIHTAASGASQIATYVDGMHLRGFQYVTVAYNKIHDLIGPDGMYGYIYMEADTTSQSNVAARDMYVYNNIIYETNSNNLAGGATGGIIFACKACISATNIYILNNTIVDTLHSMLSVGTNNATSVSNIIVANNIIYNGYLSRLGQNRRVITSLTSAYLSYLNGPYAVTTGSFGDTPTPNIIWDYNLVDINNSDAVMGFYGADGAYANERSLAVWKSMSGGDVHGVNADPSFVNWSQLNSIDLSLSFNDVAAKDRGITRNEFSDDFDGISRPIGSAWDIGAYEYIQAPPPLKGDFNSDKKVNNLDFTDFKNAFKSIFNSIFDLNSDSTIDVKDLGVLMSGWLE